MRKALVAVLAALAGCTLSDPYVAPPASGQARMQALEARIAQVCRGAPLYRNQCANRIRNAP